MKARHHRAPPLATLRRGTLVFFGIAGVVLLLLAGYIVTERMVGI